MNCQNNNNKDIYIGFLDVSNTQYKAWLDQNNNTPDIYIEFLDVSNTQYKAWLDQNNNTQDIYIEFLDVSKTQYKAWLDVIMFVTHKEGLDDNQRTLVRKLNHYLTITVDTKYGLTRTIKIKDNQTKRSTMSSPVWLTDG